MIAVSYSLDGASLEKFLQQVRQFEHNANHSNRSVNAAFNEMLEDAEALLRNRWRMNFNSGGGMYGSWPPLDPDTIRSKRGRGSPLVDTGRMRSKFFSSMYGKDSARGVEWTFRNYRGLLFHHFGTKRAMSFPNKYDERKSYVGFGNMHEPARPLVGINATDRAAVERIVRSHARKFVNVAWQNE